MSVVATLLVRVAANMTELDSSFTEMERKLQRSSKEWNKFGGQLQSIGGSLTKGLTLPLAAIGAAATTSFASFESAMKGAEAAIAPTAGELEQLRAAAIEWGQKTQFSATEAAQALGELGKAGVSTKDSVALLPNVLNLATVGSMDLASAATLTTDTLAQFKLGAADAARVNDVLAAAAQSSTIDVKDLGDSLKYAGPVAGAFGMSIEETAAALAQFGKLGFKGEMAGTALRNVLTDIKNPTAGLAEVLGQLNIKTLASADGTVHLVDVIRKLSDAGASGAQIMRAFGDRAGPAMVAAVGAGAASLQTFNDAMANSQGTAERVAKTLMSGLGGAIEQMKGAVETAAISLGELLAPALTVAADLVADLAEWVSNTLVPAFKSLPGPVQAVAGGLLLVLAAAGPLVYIAGTLASSWGALLGLFAKTAGGAGAAAAATGSLATATASQGVAAGLAAGATKLFAGAIALVTSPVTLVVAAIAGLVLGLRYLTGSWEGVLRVLTLGMVDFKTLAAIWDGLKSAASWLSAAFELVKAAIVGVAQRLAGDLAPGFADLKRLVVDVATAVGTKLVAAWDALRAAFVAFRESGVGQLISALVELNVKLQVAGILATLKLTVEGLSLAFQYLSREITNATKAIREGWNLAVDAMTAKLREFFLVAQTLSGWLGIDLVAASNNARASMLGLGADTDKGAGDMARGVRAAASALVPGLSSALAAVDEQQRKAAESALVFRGAVFSLKPTLNDGKSGLDLASEALDRFSNLGEFGASSASALATAAATIPRTMRPAAAATEELSKAAKRAREEHQKFLDSLTGAAAMAEVNKLTAALAELSSKGLKLSAAGMDTFRDALDEAADQIRTLSPKVRADMGRLYASLIPPTTLPDEYSNFWHDFRRMFTTTGPAQVIPSVRQFVGKVEDILAGLKWENLQPDPAERAAMNATLAKWGVEMKTQITGIFGAMFSGQTGFADGFRSMFGEVQRMGGSMMSSLFEGFSDQLEGFFSGDGFNWSEMFSTSGSFSAKGAMAAGAAGASVGAAFAHQFGTAAGIAAGAASGFAAGMMTGNIWAGVAGAAVGAIGGWFQGSREKKQQEQAMKQARTELLASFNSIEDMHAAADRLGVSFDRLWKTDKVEDFAAALNELNAGLTAEQNALDTLGASLDQTAASGALLTKELMESMTARPHGSDAGLAAFVKGQADVAAKGFDAFLSNTVIKTQAGATAMSASLAAVYQEMINLGAAPSAAFAAMEPAISKLNEQLAKTGFQGTAAFAPLADLARYAADTIAGPVFDAMAGLEQGLTATFNMGLLNQEAFSGFTAEIYEGYKALELQGRGGEAALAGMRGALQKVWELQQDFGYETTENEQALLDWAESAGMIGDKFRPAADRMANAIDALVDRLDQFLTRLTDGLPTAAANAAKGASDAFGENFRPQIPPINIEGRVIFDERYRENGATFEGPAFGAGAVVRRPTIALIGEKGPEAVVPLPNEFGTTTDLTVLLDSEVLTRAVLRKQPRTMRAYGVAR